MGVFAKPVVAFLTFPEGTWGQLGTAQKPVEPVCPHPDKGGAQL